ncbi:ATP-binding protein [Streptomyces jumonjinensis]|uniref:ATP-binding protein n=1 Tax=Streptomyces jumonjinensis TaxID=1945 RepID=UPI00378A731D
MDDYVWRSYRFSANDRTPAIARKALRNTLSAWECDIEIAETAELLGCELVTNVIQHAPGSRVYVEFGISGSTFTLAVVDDNPAPPRVRPESSTATNGRGLLLVQNLATDFGHRPVGAGKLVFFRLNTAPVPGHVMEREHCSDFPPTTQLRIASL